MYVCVDAVIAPCSLCSKPYVKPPSLVVWEYGIGIKTMDKVNVSMGDIVINRLSECCSRSTCYGEVCRLGFPDKRSLLLISKEKKLSFIEQL